LYNTVFTFAIERLRVKIM